MLTINATSLRATPNDSAAPPTTGGDPAGFASLLRQTQVANNNTPHTPAAPPTPHHDAAATHADAAPESATASASTGDAEASTDDTEAARAANDPTSRARTAVKTKARSADAGTSTATTKADATDEAKAAVNGEAKPTDTTATAPTAPIDPAVAQWLAALQRPAPATARADRATGTTDATTADDAATALGGKTGAARDLKAIDAKVQAEVNDKAGRGDDRFQAELAAVSGDATRGEPRVAEQAQTSSTAGVKELGAAAATAQAQPQTGVRETAAPVAVALPTPVNAPDFAQALGMQLSVFAKDGVQQAELHLNPADMGPVSVQIVMDGTQARVDFGADVAATRQAIEAGLPELASALRDAGFTLAGGGVSQHSSGRGDAGSSGGRHDDSARPGPRRVSDDSAARVSAAARRVVTAGGVDLYA